MVGGVLRLELSSYWAAIIDKMRVQVCRKFAYYLYVGSDETLRRMKGGAGIYFGGLPRDLRIIGLLRRGVLSHVGVVSVPLQNTLLQHVVLQRHTSFENPPLMLITSQQPSAQTGTASILHLQLRLVTPLLSADPYLPAPSVSPYPHTAIPQFATAPPTTSAQLALHLHAFADAPASSSPFFHFENIKLGGVGNKSPKRCKEENITEKTMD